MPITPTKNKPIVEPTIPYDRYLVNLSISPIVQETDVEAAMSLTLTPYRVLSDGSIDVNAEGRISDNNGACFASAATDPVMAQAAGAIFAAIQGYITGRGL